MSNDGGSRVLMRARNGSSRRKAGCFSLNRRRGERRFGGPHGLLSRNTAGADWGCRSTPWVYSGGRFTSVGSTSGAGGADADAADAVTNAATTTRVLVNIVVSPRK